MKMWQKEALAVASILFLVVIFTGAKPIEYVGSLAVLFTFMHAQVGFRFSEAAQNNADSPTIVSCHRWSTRYFMAKEALWFVYFFALGAWSALVGVGVFLAYPFWRKHYRLKRGCTKVASI